jgi:hypothetical protein
MNTTPKKPIALHFITLAESSLDSTRYCESRYLSRTMRGILPFVVDPVDRSSGQLFSSLDRMFSSFSYISLFLPVSSSVDDTSMGVLCVYFQAVMPYIKFSISHTKKKDAKNPSSLNMELIIVSKCNQFVKFLNLNLETLKAVASAVRIKQSYDWLNPIFSLRAINIQCLPLFFPS